jgi:hypothetical protein
MVGGLERSSETGEAIRIAECIRLAVEAESQSEFEIAGDGPIIFTVEAQIICRKATVQRLRVRYVERRGWSLAVVEVVEIRGNGSGGLGSVLVDVEIVVQKVDAGLQGVLAKDLGEVIYELVLGDVAASGVCLILPKIVQASVGKGQLSGKSG